MARPLRALHRTRTRVRRRHRTWMQAMVLASLGWGVWWSLLLWHEVLERPLPSLYLAYGLTLPPAAVGAFLAFFTLRARRIWVLLASVPLVANLSLLSVPLLFHGDLAAWFDGTRSADPADPRPDAGDSSEGGPATGPAGGVGSEPGAGD